MQSRLQIRKLALKVSLKVLLLAFASCNTNSNSKINTEATSSVDSAKFKYVASDYAQGKHTFKRLCSTCHYAPDRNVTDQYTFDKIFERLPAPSEDYFVHFISNSKSLKDSGDKYAIHLSEVSNSNFEHQFRDSITNKDFRALITYIKIAAKQRYNNGGG